MLVYMADIYRKDVPAHGEKSDNTEWMNLEPGDLTSEVSYFAGGWARDTDNIEEGHVGIWIGVQEEDGTYHLEAATDPPEDAVYVIERVVDNTTENVEFAQSEKEAFRKGQQEKEELSR